MSDSIHVLHLEDSLPDAELIRSNLEGAGIACAIKRVDTEKDFVTSLQTDKFDLVISDFSMPGYNGIAALQHLHAHYPNIPFIFVSGTLGEDHAIDSLLNGATDYVLKTKMGRLVPAVKRAVKENQEKLKRLEAEKALRQRDDRFRALIENSMDGMVVFDVNGQVTTRSPANVRLLGQGGYRPEGGSIFDRMHQDDIPRIKSEIERLRRVQGAQGRVTFKVLHGDGSWRWIEATFSNLLTDPIVKGIVSNFRDVTERIEAEAILRQAQKMESLGTLAGGIAHDFNNILGIILGYSSFITKRGVEEEKRQQCIASIRTAADRGVGLVRQLLMFARREESESIPLNMNDIVREVFKLVSETFPRVISVELETDENIGLVLGDHIQINQCVLNLCVNARDAMMDRQDGKPAGGSLKIRTGMADETMLKNRVVSPDHPPFVAISVTDTGTGMDEATVARIFEPFFTTKQKGKGTGIGLATVFGIMRKHNGFVDVSTKLGSGSTFTLCFPAVENTKGDHVADTEDSSENYRGSETILVAEDEETLRELLRDILVDKGYRVLTAENGTTAISILSENTDVALVLSDIGLPELDGIEVLARVKKERPGVFVILASGFMDPDETSTVEKSRADGFIQKPYKVNEVLKKIRETLDAV